METYFSNILKNKFESVAHGCDTIIRILKKKDSGMPLSNQYNCKKHPLVCSFFLSKSLKRKGSYYNRRSHNLSNSSHGEFCSQLLLLIPLLFQRITPSFGHRLLLAFIRYSVYMAKIQCWIPVSHLLQSSPRVWYFGF